MSYDSSNLTTPDIKWLGVRPSDLDRLNIPQQCRLPMTDEDMRTGRKLVRTEGNTGAALPAQRLARHSRQTAQPQHLVEKHDVRSVVRESERPSDTVRQAHCATPAICLMLLHSWRRTS